MQKFLNEQPKMIEKLKKFQKEAIKNNLVDKKQLKTFEVDSVYEKAFNKLANKKES